MSDTLSFASPHFNKDILLYFFGHLDDPLDLLHIFAINKELNQLANHTFLWQRLLRKYFSQELKAYASAYEINPFKLFKNLYLFRLKQYYMAFGLKMPKKEDFLLFLNMNLGYIGEVDKLKKVPPYKLIKIHAFMMSQHNFEVIENKYGLSPKNERVKVYGQALIFCCRHNHSEELKLLSERYYEYIDVNNALESGLKLAVRLGHIECIDVLIESKKFVISNQILAELLTLACTLNKKRTLNYLLTYQQDMIPDHVYGYAFTLWCQHHQAHLEVRFFKKLTLQNLQQGVLSALRYQHIKLAETLLNYFELSDSCFSFEKIGLSTFAEKNDLSGFLFLFNRITITLDKVFVSNLLKTANQHNAFDIMRFFLESYQGELPTYLAQQAKLKLEQAIGPIIIDKRPTLIFSQSLTDEIDLLSEQLESLKITSQTNQNNDKKSCSL